MIPSIKNGFKVKKSAEKAYIINNEDSEGKNRVEVYIPSLQNSLNPKTVYGTWCTCSLPVKPDIGDVVLVSYENNDLRVPIVTSNVTQAMTLNANGTSTTSGTVDNDTLVGLIGEILKENEGDYDTVLANDNGGVSVGLLGWHENNARDDIFKKIKETNLSDWNKGSSSITRSLDQTWVSYIPNTTECSGMKSILASDTGKSVQDGIINEYIQSYLDAAKSCGITDIKCQMYYCDFANQASNDAKKCAKWCGTENLNDLDKFHNKILSGSGWPAETTANRNRRTRTYNHILEFESSGQLATAMSSGSSSGQLVWPIPGYPVVSYKFGNGTPSYGGWHSGVDINNSGNTVGTETCLGAKLIACCDGSAKFGSDGYGNWIHIQKTGTEMHCYYFHLDHFATGFSAGNTYTVTTGQLLGYAGKTGKATGPHLHFEIRDGGTDAGSRSESSHGYLVDPELYLAPDGSSGSSSNGSKNLVSENGINNDISFDITVRSENYPPYAKTDYSKCELNELVPFVYYKPNSVSLGSWYNPGSLFPEAQSQFEKMREAGISALGSKYSEFFVIKNGFRSYNDQMKLYELRKNNDENSERTAKAGFSEHQLGLAIDLYIDDYNKYGGSFEKVVIPWIKSNGHKYGFIIRYPEGKVSITGYRYKPYHLRYVGVEIATKIYNNGGTYLALEEILKTK